MLRPENMEALRTTGAVFCLTADPATILERTRGNEDRPLLKTDDPRRRIEELLAKRKEFYDKAGVAISTEGKTPLQVALEILEIVKCGK